jgi:GNAT superfamily N-acetyltransferase
MSIDGVGIRTATVDDLETLFEFEQAIIATERPFDETIRIGPNVHYYDLEALIKSSDAEVVVAELNSAIIGSGYAKIVASDPYLKHSRHAYLGFMYVVPEHRGKGVNKRVLDALEGWSRSRQVVEIRLEVYASNAGAIRAYEKSGYERLVMEMRKGLI